jgi:hypothetical protein
MVKGGSAQMGGFIVNLLGGNLYGINLIGLLGAVGGASFLLFIYRQNVKYLPDQEIRSSVSPEIQQNVDTQGLLKASPKKSQSGIILSLIAEQIALMWQGEFMIGLWEILAKSQCSKT